MLHNFFCIQKMPKLRPGVEHPVANVEPQKHQRKTASGNPVKQCYPLSANFHCIFHSQTYSAMMFSTGLPMLFGFDFFIMDFVHCNPVVVDHSRCHEVDNCSFQQNQTDEGQTALESQNKNK